MSFILSFYFQGDLKIEPKKEILPKGENTFLYAESKRAKLEREKVKKMRK